MMGEKMLMATEYTCLCQLEIFEDSPSTVVVSIPE
jgi:hypothetical protein